MEKLLDYLREEQPDLYRDLGIVAEHKGINISNYVDQLLDRDPELRLEMCRNMPDMMSEEEREALEKDMEDWFQKDPVVRDDIIRYNPEEELGDFLRFLYQTAPEDIKKKYSPTQFTFYFTALNLGLVERRVMIDGEEVAPEYYIDRFSKREELAIAWAESLLLMELQTMKSPEEARAHLEERSRRFREKYE